MENREKGVASAPCPNCGKALHAVTQPDGGTAYESCSRCYPASGAKPAKQRASVQIVRELGSPKEADSE